MLQFIFQFLSRQNFQKPSVFCFLINNMQIDNATVACTAKCSVGGARCRVRSVKTVLQTMNTQTMMTHLSVARPRNVVNYMEQSKFQCATNFKLCCK